MALIVMIKEPEFFGGEFEMLFMSIICKMQIIVLINDSKSLIIKTDTENMYPFFELEDHPIKMHPSCHLYLLSYNCPMNPSYTNMLTHYMFLAVKDRKRANPFVGYMLSLSGTYISLKKSNSAV